MYRRIGFLVAVCGALVGCGGGHAPTDQLFTLRVGSRWVYRFAGSVTLPASQGGGTQTVRPEDSTLTVEVANGTAQDAQGTDVGILSRRFQLVLLDGRTVDGTLLLYYTQTPQGIFVHGMQRFMGQTPGSPVWVPGTATPAYQFLYLPNPASDGSTLGYGAPFDGALAGGYALTLSGPRTVVTVPAGTFSAKFLSLNEAFDGFTLTYSSQSAANFSPEAGILAGNVTAALADGTLVSGTISLLSRS